MVPLRTAGLTSLLAPPRPLRELEAFANAECRTVSSRQLGKALGLSDAQVRKDLAYSGSSAIRASAIASRS